ncbi:MAG: TonB-dependent receptor [Desulfohalobiaceae bacterium]
MHAQNRIEPTAIPFLRGITGALVLLLFLFSFPVGSSFATNTTSSLQEMVVTASRVQELKRKTTTNIEVIQERDIELSSADTLGDLLAERGLGHFHKYPGVLTTIGIRGFRGEAHGNDLKGRVLVLLNGRRAGTGNVAKIMTENVEKIEIIRGPSSVQYGSAAMGGVINVITKQGKGDPSGFAQGELGSFDHEKASAGLSGAAGTFDFSGSYSRSNREDYTTADGEKYHNTGYEEKEHASLNLGYTFLPGNRIGVIYTGFDAEEVGDPQRLSQNDLDDYSDKKNESLDLIYDGSAQETPLSWKARYFTGKDENTWHDPVASNPGGAMGGDDGIPSSRDVDNQGAQAQASYSPGRYRITAGWDWVNYEVDSDYSGKYEYDNPSYFLLGKAGFLDKNLNLSAGLRFDQYEVEDQDENRDFDNQHTTPSLGIAWLPFESLKLRANYSEGFRMPPGNGVFGSEYHEPNPDLDPEEMQTYEAGIDFAYRSLNTSLTYFLNDFEDMIVSEEIGLWTYQYRNIGEATTSGLEGRFSWDAGPLLDLQWSFVPYGSFVYMTEYENERTGEDLPYVSDLTASWGLKIRDNQGFAGNLGFSYTGEQRITYPEDTQKGGFTVANLSLRQKILDAGKFGDLSLKGEIRNLLDKRYSHVEGYPMPGRSFYLGLRYNY